MEYTLSLQVVSGANKTGLLALRRRNRTVIRVKGVLWSYSFFLGTSADQMTFAVSKSARHLLAPPTRLELYNQADTIFGLLGVSIEIDTPVSFQIYRTDHFVRSDKLIMPPLVMCVAAPITTGFVRCTLLYDEVEVSETEYATVLWDSITRPGNRGF